MGELSRVYVVVPPFWQEEVRGGREGTNISGKKSKTVQKLETLLLFILQVPYCPPKWWFEIQLKTETTKRIAGLETVLPFEQTKVLLKI